MSRPRQKQLAAPVYVEIALPIPLRRTFTYRLGAEMRDAAQLGSRLIVPFGNRKLTGFAVEFYDELPADSELEDSAIRDAIELEPSPGIAVFAGVGMGWQDVVIADAVRARHAAQGRG